MARFILLSRIGNICRYSLSICVKSMQSGDIGASSCCLQLLVCLCSCLRLKGSCASTLRRDLPAFFRTVCPAAISALLPADESQQVSINSVFQALKGNDHRAQALTCSCRILPLLSLTASWEKRLFSRLVKQFSFLSLKLNRTWLGCAKCQSSRRNARILAWGIREEYPTCRL